MKQVFSYIVLSFIVLQISAQSSQVVCNAGFSFEISNNPNWGRGEPVVVHITPGSPAERAGLQLDDIILEVNRKGTYLKPQTTVESWMLDNDKPNIEISIRNLETDFKTINIRKDCRRQNGIDEAKLASVFAFYSLEDVQNRTFHIPMDITTNPEADFTNYRTFDFAPADENTPDIDTRITALFEDNLKKRGLKRDIEDPDFIIQTFYSYQNNPDYEPSQQSKKEMNSVSWRFDVEKGRMIKLPLYSPTDVVDNKNVAYFLEFGYRFYDKKHIEPGKLTQIIECEVKEQVKSNYGLENYLRINLPLILLKYPYPANLNKATYEVDFLKYNYTGMSFDIDNIARVVSVDPNSPAAKAGVKENDIIKSIQDIGFNDDLNDLTKSYRMFISETMNLRNPKTRYTDNNGYKDCMFWEVGEYHQVSEILHKKRYRTAFTYLFNFNQYIDWKTPSSLSIDIEREGESLKIEIIPEVLESVHISAF